MRFLIGQVMHETNTFSNVKTTEEAFRASCWATGEQLVETYRGVRTYVGGMIDSAEQLHIEIIPTFGATAKPSGIITSEAYVKIKSELLHQINKAGKCDAVCLSLHGAGVADGVEDIEGDLIQAVREAIGKSILLVITLDLHANVTDRMVEGADLIIGDNYYPHIDSYERGQEVVKLAKQILDGTIRPVMHLTQIPLLIPTTGTSFRPVDRLNELCWQYESQADVIDCTFYHGFPFSDITEAGVSVLAITNDNMPLAKQISEEIAAKVMEWKGEFFQKHPTPHEGIKLALASSVQPVVMNETSDNPGGGTPGDGTHLLRAMIEAEVQNACFAPLYDPEVVEIAHRSGAGTYIEVQLGGKTDTMHGTPIEVRAYVKSLTDGRFITSSPMGKGAKVNLGKSARLQINGLDVVVCSVRSQVFDEQFFILHGINIMLYKLVALKSSHHFRAAFTPLTDLIITVDSPGLSMFDFTHFPYQHVRRPIYPLDS